MGRWCGTIVVDSDGAQVMVGNPKEPCDVGELQAPWILPLTRPVPLSGCILRLDGEDRIELATEILKSNDRRQLDQLFLREMPLQPVEKTIRDPLVGVSHPLA